MHEPETPPPPPAPDYRTLPEPVALADTVAMQDTRPVPDPTTGRDAELQFLLRHAG